MGSCFTVTADVVTTLLETVTGGATVETMTEVTILGFGGVTTVAEMDVPFVFTKVTGYIFITFGGFCCFTVDEPVTHLCGNQEQYLKYRTKRK
jgi:hypothetical protein